MSEQPIEEAAEFIKKAMAKKKAEGADLPANPLGQEGATADTEQLGESGVGNATARDSNVSQQRTAGLGSIEDRLRAAGRSPHQHEKPTPKITNPLEPWRLRRDDFLCVPRTPEVTTLEERFDKQVALLNEIVKPIKYDDTLWRNGKGLTVGAAGVNQYLNYMYKVPSNFCDFRMRTYRKSDRIAKPLFDLVCFPADGKGFAFVQAVSDLNDVPFQGIGGFGLAIIPTSIRRSDVDVVVAKVGLGKFLGVVPQDIEAILVTRASKFDFKRLGEVEAAGIPILFDLSGRSQPSKRILDPLEGMMDNKGPRNRVRFTGTLTEEQAGVAGAGLNGETATRMISALKDGALGSDAKFMRPRWTSESVAILTFGREQLDDGSAQDATGKPRGAQVPLASRRSANPTKRPWQFMFAEFPPECMPTLDSARDIQRMHDVGTIWRKVLADYGLELLVDREQFRPTLSDCNPKVQEIGKLLGIDVMIESLYDGVPLDYII